MIESWEIAGGLLEYIDESHTYIFDGEILPSITQILKIKFGKKYKSKAELVGGIILILLGVKTVLEHMLF